jgi:diguanylate cyclase (GGDEF)-like protein
MEILRVMRDKRVRPAHIITVSARTDMDARLESVRAGGTAFLTKPVDLSVLLDKIDNLTFDGPKAPYRVMLVSELGTRAREVALGLGQLNMLVSLVDDSSELLDPIAEFQPEVIVLETRYRSCTGMELASMLRQDDQFVGIPILFLSDEVNEVRQTAAIRVGADDFLSGDLSIKRISSAIAARADRARVLRSYMEKDGLTGLLNHSRIENQLEVEVFRAQRRNAPCSVAMIDLDGFKKINDTYGHAFGDRVLRSLSLMLRQRLRRTDFVGRWGGEEFAVVLPDTPASVAQRVLDEIRDGFSRVRHMYEGRPIFVTYSCGIAAVPDESRAVSAEQGAALAAEFGVPFFEASAKTGEGIDKILPAALALHAKSRQRLSTKKLNEAIRELAEERPGPRDGKRRLSMRFLVQTGTNPPVFRLEVNDRVLMTRDYGFWLENRLRDRFDLAGVPVDIEVRSRR